jgi:hypothetical protein
MSARILRAVVATQRASTFSRALSVPLLASLLATGACSRDDAVERAPSVRRAALEGDAEPVVNLTAPANGAAVSGLVELAAAATDADGVEQVEFFVDGASLGVDSTEPFTAEWLASAAGAGAHQLRARATDSLGNVGESPVITVTLPSSESHPGLVAAWGFDEGIGTETHDATGASQNAALTGQMWVSGKYGNALQFGSDHLTVASSPWLNLSQAMTLSAWVLPDADLEAWPVVLQKGWQPAYFLRPGSWWSSEFGFRAENYDWFVAQAPRDVEAKPGAWTHVAGTYDGQFVRLYLNGEVVAQYEASVPILSAAEALTIGGNGDPGAAFPGRLDEIRIYNRALSAAEIASDMATPVTPGAAPDTTPPEVDVVEPASGATVSGLVTLSADVEDDGGVRSVRFLVDGAPFGAEFTKPPYTRTWHASSSTAGTHSIQAEATDTEGNTQLSAAVNVIVPESASQPGLVLALGFDEGEGQQTHDATGAGHDGVLSGQTWASGKFGSSLEFNGQVLEVVESDLLDVSEELTLSAWVLPRPGNPHRSTVAAKRSWWGFSYALFGGNEEGGPALEVLGDDWAWADVGTPTTVSTWTHLAATSNSSGLKVYVNGQLAQVNDFDAGPLSQVDGPFYVGGDPTDSGLSFIGRIDELRVYRRVLSASEIAADMAKPITAGASSETTPPVVSLSAPANGATVSGLIVLAADASDANGVEQVEFLVDGDLLGVDRTAPFSEPWLASAAGAGTHELVARATDFAGNVSVSSPITVTLPSTVSHPGLVAAWGFDEGTGAVTHDATGAGNDASLSDQTWVTGKFGSALQFSANRIDVAHSQWLNLSHAMTLSAWVLPEVELENSVVVLQKGWQSAYWLRPGSWWSAESGFRSDTYDWFSALAPHGVEAKPGAWTHVAGTYDGQFVRLYLNGEVVAENEASAPILSVSEPLMIGGSDHEETLFPGRLDEIRIYNRALSAAEIASDMVTPVTAGAEPDTTPPEVELVQPASGATVSGLVTLSADVEDDSGIRNVRFFVDGAPFGAALTAPPYTRTWHANSATAGTHSFQAEATDTAGNTQLSAAVNITVPESASMPGLVLALGFDEGEGEQTHDAAGTGHDGVLSGQTWAPGKFGSSLEFSGQLLEINDSYLLDLTDAATLSAWVLPRPGNPRRSTVLVKQNWWDPAYELFAGNQEGGPQLLVLTHEWGWADVGAPTPLSTWSHIAATLDGNELKVYVNGQLAQANAFAGGTLRQVDGPLHVGGDATQPGNAFIGRIDELRIYNRVLSAGEIAADMSKPITAGASSETTPPVVSLSAPAGGSAVSGLVVLAADVSDANGVEQVEFLVDGASVGIDRTEPFSAPWLASAAAAGTHELVARATDFAGNVGVSAPVTVTLPSFESHPGLVAAWGFDEGAGTEAHDATGAGHHATLTGQAWVAGKYGSALQFGSDNLAVASSPWLDLSQSMTLSAWVLPDVELEASPIVLQKGWQPAYFLRPGSWWAAETGIRAENYDWFALQAPRDVEAKPGAWTHVAGTYDGSMVRLYLNGAQVAETPASVPIPKVDGAVMIGGNGDPNALFPGRLDEIRIYNRALSAAEIESDMATPITAGATADTTPPTIALTEPEGGAVAGLVTLAATASDDSGIRHLQFMVDGQPLGTPLTSPPYTRAWHSRSATPGSHQVWAQATDRAGNVASTDVVTLVVDPADSVPGLVLAFGFDENGGDVTHDASGAGHDAPLSGQAWRTGKYGSSLEFDGQLLTVPSSYLLDLTTGMTLSAWVLRRPDLSSWSTLLMKNRDDERSYFLYTGSADRPPEICVEVAGSLCVGGQAPPPASVWTHLAATYDAHELRLYVNGEIDATLADASGTLPQVGGSLHLGGNLVWPQELFRGRLDELRIYNRPLSQAEIQADMSTPITEGALPDMTPPTVSLTAPSNGATVSGLARLEASANDDTAVKSVEFLVDGVLLGQPVLSAPFTKAWHTASVSQGEHQLTARAIDYAGNVGLSAPVAVTVVATAPAAGLVAAFGFDEGDGASTVDATGHGHDTSLTGQTWVPGKFGSALEFDGTYLTVADSDFLDLTSQMTLSAWVMPTAPVVIYPTIVAKEGDLDHALSYVLYATTEGGSGPGSFFKVGDDWFGVSGGQPPAVNVWTHLAATYDREAIRIYVNGAQVAETAASAPLPTSSAPLRIGGNSIWDVEVFRGRIDELRVYARALSAVEIEADMAQPVNAPSGPDTTPPVVALTAPEAGANVSGTVPLRAQATDAGGIASVRFFVDGEALGSPLTAPPYEASWSTAGATPGAHTLRADATDLAGNSASSASVTVTLTAPPACDPATVSDGNPCTTDTCSGDVAVFTNVAAGTSCSNGNRCDGEEACNAAGSCQPGTPPSSDATCDGVDDDCDGSLDEDYPVLATTCGVGACRATGSKTCAGGSEHDSCTPRGPVTASDVTCNGVDDDCDGPIDEDYVPTPIQCGVGACQAEGTRVCSLGALQDFCVPGNPSASDATCNNVDDDCDGQRDEDFVAQPTQCGAGACQATGVTHCALGVVSDSCSAASGGGNDSVCDGVDSDCDGAVDEGYVPHATTCGVGACVRSGTSSCVGGHEALGCVAGTPGSDANCNGIDDDCDGSVDEDYEGHATTCGVGACAATGTSQCVGGVEEPACAALQPLGPDTTCNGVDDDCNGSVDDAFVVTTVSCGVGACAATGSITCDHGQPSNGCHAGTGATSDTTCNGVDDDCDGSTDEDYLPQSMSCGIGACARNGETRCQNGAVEAVCTAGTPAASDSDCNGVDDDCDGATDEGYVGHTTTCGQGSCSATGTTACQAGHEVDSCTNGSGAATDTVCNGIDDDCDGSKDEDYVPVSVQCGVGACAATGTTSCQNGVVVSGCTAGSPISDDSNCNGVDDDCDGSVDEAYLPRAVACGIGACRATGVTSCASGIETQECTPGTPATSDASCDGIDNDCDGSRDEDYVGSPTTCGQGACAASGATTCSAGHVTDSCQAGSPATSDATCNGVDDDCDGTLDEDYLPQETACGVGACRSTGSLSCQSGHATDTCSPLPKSGDDSDCDGVDDDCDGQTDESFGIRCAGTAVESCSSGALQTQECSDSDTCNGSESCSSGHCVAGTPVSTSDGNPCTADACGPEGVSHTPLALGADCGTARVCDGQGTCIGKPVITTQPSSTTVSPGGDANFGVSATGALLSYQWRRLGQPIAGATSPTLTLSSVQPADSGAEITVAVSNPAGTVVSSAVTLTVSDTSGPVLTIDGDAQRDVATDTAVLTGTVLDNGQPAASIVATSSRFPGQVAGIIDAGSGAFRIEVPVSPGVNAITLTAKDAVGNATQKSILATLELSRLPRVTLTQPTNGLETQADKLDVSGYVRSSLPPEQIRLVLGDVIIFPTGSGGQYSFTFKDVRLNFGPNLIAVRAETPDGAVTAQAAVLRTEPGTVSDDAPVVAVIGGASLQFVKDATLPIKGTVTAKRCTSSVTVNGASAPLIGAGASVSFAATLALPAGDQEVPVEIIATDCDNRIGKLTYKVVHDDVAPVIDVALAPSPAVHNVSTTPYLIAGRITEGHLATVSSNQQSLGVLPGALGSYDFSFAVPLTRGVDEVVTIEAVDLAGNTATHALKLHLDAAVDIEIISPAAASTIQTLKDPVDVDVVARIVGLPSNFSAVVRLDSGGVYALTRADSTFKTTLSVRGTTASHSLAISVLNDVGTSVATESVSFKVTDANSIPVQASLKSPLGGSSNVEANEPVVIELNRPVADPKKIKIEVTETVHGKRYKPYALGASISEFTNVQLEDVNRDQAPVPGGMAFLPGDRLYAFYPARDYGYGGQVSVRILNDGVELARGQFAVRPLPTLATGFVADQFFNPVPELDVRLDDIQVTTQTNGEGVFSLGFGKAEVAIPPGRHKLVLNPGMKNPSYGVVERWIDLQAGRMKDLGVAAIPLLDAGEPFRRIAGGQASVLLRGGDVDLDLSRASLIFPDGTTEGNVHADVFFGPAVGYPAISVGVPLLSYSLQPMGIQVSGPFGVTFALPAGGNSNYIDVLPDYVLLVGLDPEALLLVPIGVGRVDREQRRVRSARALEARRLDFIGMAPLTGSSFQSLFSKFADGLVDLPTLTMALEKTR